MKDNTPPAAPSEGTVREELAAYFLSQAPLAQLSPRRRREYMEKLQLLGALEQQEICAAAGAGRPLVWGNPAQLLQAFLSAAQRLAAGLGQPLLLFPAKDAVIGADSLIHPRLLTVALAELLCRACRAAPRQPVWVRLQEQLGALAVSVTARAPFVRPDTLAILNECTRLHGGSLVHCEHAVLFTCGQTDRPPPGVRLYGCPSEEDLLQDTLSPVWSGFYAGLYSVLSPAASGAEGAAPASAEADGAAAP